IRDSVSDGIWRSNQPGPSRIAALGQAGIKTIINLRGPRQDGGWQLEAEACAKAGITKPITPGILPIENWQGVKRFAKRCSATLPVWLEDAYAKAERDQRTDLLSIALCTELCSELVDEGVEALHFYTLNRPELTRDVCAALGIHPKVTLQHVA
ncbi:MAG: hypothetical protein EBY46_07740, partial [Rhodobacteraceae bacterium]|nr:hypothetical protein [Paracoccaceae bacterium]